MMAAMLTWRSDDPAGPGLEAARVVVGDVGFRAVGRMVRTTDDGVFTASYRLQTGAAGALSRLVVDSASDRGERSLTITRSDGVWLVDSGSGASRLDAGDARDVDLAFSPVFNALPIRRLDLHRAASERCAGAAGIGTDHVLPMVFVSLPEATVEVTEQTYRTVEVGTPSVVRFSAGGFVRDMTVDADGLVVDYPDIARRA